MSTTNAPIIVSINLLSENECLLEYGLHFAKMLDVSLIIFDTSHDSLFINPAPIGDPMLGTAIPVQSISPPEWTNEIVERMDKIVEEIRQRHPNTEGRLIEDLTGWNNRNSFLLQEVTEIQPQLLIIENKSSHGLLNEWFGTAETDVAQTADCPVLMIPKACAYQPLTQINYLLERKKSLVKSTQELQYLVQLARPFSAKIEMIYLSKADSATALKELVVKHSQILPSLNYENIGATQLAHTERLDDIDQLGKNKSGELTAFTYQNSTFWQRLFSHDNTRHLVLEAKSPVLAF